jgi:hypothetical protein
MPGETVCGGHDSGIDVQGGRRHNRFDAVNPLGWFAGSLVSGFSSFFPERASILRKARTAATIPTIRSTASPTPPEAQAIESRKVQTLLKIRIEDPMSNISIQMILFIFLLWSD